MYQQISTLRKQGGNIDDQSGKNTSPCVLGIIVALAIFSSITPRVPLSSSEALKNTPELLGAEKRKESNCKRKHLYKILYPYNPSITKNLEDRAL